MSQATLSPRVDSLLSGLDSWSTRGAVRALVVKVLVTVAGPLVILAGVAMLVLPGPGLLVMAAGLALLALEYPWARRALAFLGHKLGQLKNATLPQDASRSRRALGLLMVAAVAVAGFAATTAVTAFLGAHTVL